MSEKIKLLVATGNRHKLQEIETMFRSYGIEQIELLALDTFPEYCPPEEDGDTFEANAFIKAESAARYSGLPTLADDSGLVVDALNGAPGIYSARFAGPDCEDSANRKKLLAEMAEVPDDRRQAAFICNAALVWPKDNGEILRINCVGRCPGKIIREERGAGGFGYDPIFVPEGNQFTMAEISPEEKNSISHRGQAMKMMTEELKKIL